MKRLLIMLFISAHVHAGFSEPDPGVSETWYDVANELQYITSREKDAHAYMASQCLKGLYKIEQLNMGSVIGQQYVVNFYEHGQFMHYIFRCNWSGKSKTRRLLDKIVAF